MKRIGYRNGYRIQIKDCFYEVVDGKKCLFFGYCRKNSTIQEIANKTILQEVQENERRTVRSNYFRNHNSNTINNLYMTEDLEDGEGII